MTKLLWALKVIDRRLLRHRVRRFCFFVLWGQGLVWQKELVELRKRQEYARDAGVGPR